MSEDSRACLRTTGDWTGHYLRVGGARLVSVCKVRAEGQKASGDTESEGFAPRGQPLQSCNVHDAGALDLNDAFPAELIKLPARTAAPRLAPRNPHLPLQPHAQPPQPAARSIISAQPAFASTRSQRSCPPMHAAHQRGPAMSAASSARDSVPATLPHHLRSHCLHAPPPLDSPLAKPPPHATALRPTAPAHSTQHHHRIAGVRKHPLTAQAQPMHAAYR